MKEKRKEKNQRVFYVFKLEEEQEKIGRIGGWKFVEQTTTLDWIDNPITRAKTHHSIDHEGVFTMAYAESDAYDGHQLVSVLIQS